MIESMCNPYRVSIGKNEINTVKSSLGENQGETSFRQVAGCMLATPPKQTVSQSFTGSFLNISFRFLFTWNNTRCWWCNTDT